MKITLFSTPSIAVALAAAIVIVMMIVPIPWAQIIPQAPVPAPALTAADIAAADTVSYAQYLGVTPTVTYSVGVDFVPPEPPPDGGCKFLGALGMACRVEAEEFLTREEGYGVRVRLKAGDVTVTEGTGFRIGPVQPGDVPPAVWEAIKANPTFWTSFVGTNVKLLRWGFGSWAWKAVNALIRHQSGGGPSVMAVEAITDQGWKWALDLMKAVPAADIIYFNELERLWFIWIR